MDFQFRKSTKGDPSCPYGAYCDECALFIKMYEEKGDKLVQTDGMCAIVANALLADRSAKRIDGLHAAFNEVRNGMAQMVAAVLHTVKALRHEQKGEKVIDAGPSA